MIADAGLAVMTVLAMIRYDGTVWSMLRRLSKPAAAVMATVAMLCVGPLLCIPRTCATTFEMGVLPLFPECSPWLFGALFFGAVFILTVRPSAVIDIIGKFLTPALLLTLAVLFVKGVIHPIGTISTAAPAVNVAQEGLLAGYQTMDVFGALAITLVVVNTVKEKGYSEEKLRFGVISKSSIVAALGLFFVYCALSFLGATSSELELGAGESGRPCGDNNRTAAAALRRGAACGYSALCLPYHGNRAYLILRGVLLPPYKEQN